MKAMPLPLEEFQGKGLLDYNNNNNNNNNNSFLLLQQQQQQQHKWLNNNNNNALGFFYVGNSNINTNTEPASVLDNRRSPSPPTSSSTLSSSLGSGGGGGGGGGSTDTTNTTTGVPSSVVEKCGLGMDDWDGVLPVGGGGGGSGGSPSQEQSILRLMMGDIEDPSSGLNKLLTNHDDLEFNNAGFGVVDHQGFGFEHNNNNLGVFQQPPVPIQSMEEKPQLYNPQMMINQSQTQFIQNPAMFMPLSYTAQLQEHHHYASPPPLKRLNSGPPPGVGPLGQSYQPPKVHVMDSSQNQFQSLQQAITDQISKAAELIETGNPVLAQGILARLNQQLSAIGKPLQRAAFYFKEALLLLVQMNNSGIAPPLLPPSSYSMIFKIGAYKSFSEISPVLQFTNFTCNQALLEAFKGCEQIHIIDFDISYGGQWASLMQELVLSNRSTPSLKITVFASPLSYDEVELSFTQENLKQFARDLQMPFEMEILSLESLNSNSWRIRASENEAIAVNLPIGSFVNQPVTFFPTVLRFVKQLSPKIVVSLDRGCDRTDLPFPHHIIYALQSYTGLLESLDAMNVNLEALQKIERFMIQPAIEKIVLSRPNSPGSILPWRNLFLQAGFSPLTFSNFTESQAECLVQRTPVRGFHVEKRQSSLVLCWQRKDLVSASAWSC
ncbi:hypothetical protein ACFE04_017191 [Oxalis oulophora]